MVAGRLAGWVLYLPQLVVAVVLLRVGFVLSRFLSRGALIAAVNARMRAAKLPAGPTRAAVMLVAITVAFEHVGIGRATVLTAFAILFGGVTLAAALAVGLGRQDIVRRRLDEQLQARPRATENDPISHM